MAQKKKHELEIHKLRQTVGTAIDEKLTEQRQASKSALQRDIARQTADCRLEKIKSLRQNIIDLKETLDGEIDDRKEVEKRLRERDIEVGDLQDQVRELMDAIHDQSPRRVKKVWKANDHGKGGREVWPDWVVMMVMELLSHCTPPSSIAANILTVCESIYPDGDIVKELPGMSFNRETRDVVSYTAKAMAGNSS